MSDADEVCACCGIAAVDDIKLKDCDGGCDLVKYCSDVCHENYREQHEEECKKRRAELHDKKLFTPPDSSHLGECPICCLPLPLDESKSFMMSCCCKYICNGCFYANREREDEGRLERRCVYCREPTPKSKEEGLKRIMERVEKNDPVAMRYMGRKHDEEGDYRKALEYFTKAAELGDVAANAFLGGRMYFFGEGVEKDMKKAVYHLEQAAIGGHPGARVFLADYEINNARIERAARHYIIAANLGCNDSLQEVKDLFVQGKVSKEEYAGALRGYQAAVNETKSAERDEAEAYYTSRRAYD
jgi:tetratricopeptide (TPR) repeat protein